MFQVKTILFRRNSLALHLCITLLRRINELRNLYQYIKGYSYLVDDTYKSLEEKPITVKSFLEIHGFDLNEWN